MGTKKYKKEPIKKQNERLSQELVTERKIISQLRNSLEVMDAGWSLDKIKLTQALEELNKLEVYFNKNDEENNSEKNMRNTVKLEGRENIKRKRKKRVSNKFKITAGFLNNKMCEENVSNYEARLSPKFKIYKVPGELKSLKSLKRRICEEDKSDSDERVLSRLKVYDVPDDITSEQNGIHEENDSDNLVMAQDKTDCDIKMENISQREKDNGIMSCPLCCNESFSTQESLKYHLLSIFENVFCPICARRYDNILSLINHLGMECDGQPKYDSDTDDVGDSIYKQALATKSSDESFTLPQDTLAMISFKVSSTPKVPNDVLNSILIVPDNEESSPVVLPSNALNDLNNHTSDNIQQNSLNHKQTEHESDCITVEDIYREALEDTIEYQNCDVIILSDDELSSEVVPIINQTSDSIPQSGVDNFDQTEDISICLDSAVDDTSGCITVKVEDISKSITEVVDEVVDDISEALNDTSNYIIEDNNISMIEETEPSNNEFTCSACDSTFVSISDHIMEYHLGEEVQVVSPSEELKEKLSQWEMVSGEDTVNIHQHVFEEIEQQINQSIIVDENKEQFNQSLLKVRNTQQLDQNLLKHRNQSSNDERNIDLTTVNGYWTKSGSLYKFVNSEEKMRLLNPSYVSPSVKLRTSTNFEDFGGVCVQGKKLRLSLDNLNLIQIVDDSELSQHCERLRSKICVYIIDKDIQINQTNLGPVAKVIDTFPQTRLKRNSKSEKNTNKQEPVVRKNIQYLKKRIIHKQFINLLEVQLGSDKKITIENIDFKKLPAVPESMVPYIDDVGTPLIPLLEKAKLLKWCCTFCLSTTSTVHTAVTHSCYICEHCGKGVEKSIRAVKNHILKAHPTKSVNPSWRDKNVKHILKTENGNYILEKGRIHPIIPTEEEKMFICNDCKIGYTTQEGYDRHLLSKKHKALTHCEICKKTVAESELEVHMKWHEENKFYCGYCNKTYATELLYSVHEATHKMKLLHQEEYVCHLCKKSFTNRTFLRSHILQHDFSRPYACQYCFKRFRKKSEREVHERIHNNKRPDICKVCGKSFRKPYSLYLHSLRHTGKKKFICVTCNKAFFTKASLNTHMTIHSDDKPHKCPYCEKRFKTLAALIGHKKNHVQPFKCPFCPLAFGTLSGVRTHLPLHEPGVVAFHCMHCSALYRRKYHLNLHIERVHGIITSIQEKVIPEGDEDIELSLE